MGELENTLVIYIWGDNGASMEGTLTGTFNELTMVNGIPLTDEEQMQLALKWGGLEAWGDRDDVPALLSGLGLGGQHARSSGASRSPRTWAARATRWSCTGPSGSRTRAGCARSSRT